MEIVCCTACGRQVNHFQRDSFYRHPVLKVLICKVSLLIYQKPSFRSLIGFISPFSVTFLSQYLSTSYISSKPWKTYRNVCWYQDGKMYMTVCKSLHEILNKVRVCHDFTRSHHLVCTVYFGWVSFLLSVTDMNHRWKCRLTAFCLQ